MLAPSLGLAIAISQPAAITDAPPDDDATAIAAPLERTADPFESDDPELEWPDEDVPVAPLPYGLRVREVDNAGGRRRFVLKVQEWDDLVEQDPYLNQLHRRSRALTPGAILIATGGVHLVVASALAFDGTYATTATGALAQWGLGGAVLVTGTILTVIGVRARRQLRAEQQRLYFAPTATRQSAGATASIRF